MPISRELNRIFKISSTNFEALTFPVYVYENRMSHFRGKSVTDRLTDRQTHNDDYTCPSIPSDQIIQRNSGSSREIFLKFENTEVFGGSIYYFALFQSFTAKKKLHKWPQSKCVTTNDFQIMVITLIL